MADTAQPFTGARASSSARRGEILFTRVLLCLVVASLQAAVAAALFLGTAFAYHAFLRHEQFEPASLWLYGGYSILLAFFEATFAAFAASRFLEQTVRTHTDYQQTFLGWTAAVALTLLTAFLAGHIGDMSRVTLTATYLLGIPVMMAAQRVLQSAVDARISRGELRFDSVSIIGKRSDVVHFLLGADLWKQGQKLQDVLYLEDARDETGALLPETISEFAARTVKRGTDQIVLVGGIAELDEFGKVATELRRYALNLLYAPASDDRGMKLLDVVSLGPNNVVRFVKAPINESSVFLKRTFDVVLSALGLLILSPLLALVALAIVVESRGPVIYRQARRGFNGDTFMIWKFRSMRVAESGYQMTQAQKNDPRVTRVGRFIRATSIDELPQLVNVLLGQMSLVGPRPHAVSHDAELSHMMAEYAHRQRIKPGITGWAQVNGYRGETTTHEQIAGRVEYDIHYIDNWSMYFDIWILVLTVLSPATRRNAH
jgi:Undecaprenyl-phosphate glucose phosphotransferase